MGSCRRVLCGCCCLSCSDGRNRSYGRSYCLPDAYTYARYRGDEIKIYDRHNEPANGGRHKAMPCQAETVLKAPGGQPAFQQLKGATALYCLPAPRLLCRRLAARYFGGAPPGMYRAPLYEGTGTTDPG